MSLVGRVSDWRGGREVAGGFSIVLATLVQVRAASARAVREWGRSGC